MSKDLKKLPKQARSRDTVETLIQATTRILEDEGLDRLTTNRVARVAGVSIGSLYQYFPSKEALVAALVERMLADDLAWMTGTLEAGPLRPQLPRLVAALCERQAAQAEVMATILPQLPALQRDQAARTAFQAMVDAQVPRLLAEPDLRPDLLDPERLAKALFVTSRALRWVLNEAVLEHPEWLADPDFQAEVVRLWDPLFG